MSSILSNLNSPVEMSGVSKDNFLEVNFQNNQIVFDLSNQFNLQFSKTKKRNNRFDDKQIVEPGFLKAINGLSKTFEITAAIDIGCQHLYTSLIMQKLFDCDLYAYDIDEEALQAAKLNLQNNFTDKLQIINQGIGNGVDDNFITLNDLPDVDLIMIDVEGHQFKIFKAGIEYINKKRPIVILETDTNYAINFFKPDKLAVQDFESYTYFYCDNHRNVKESFRPIEQSNIPQNDGLLIAIPREKI